MRRLIPISVGIILMLSAGCYRTYMGYYQLPPSTLQSSAAEKVLITEVEQVIRPLGFGEAAGFGQGRIAYSNEKPITVEGDGRWPPHRLSVIIDLRERLVGVQDLDHDYETPFVRSLKESLEKRLKARYDLVELKFERHIDLFQ